MATNHPYISSAGHIYRTMDQFRKSFPQKIDANLFKKLGIAPNNESYLISIIRFLGLIEEDGSRTDLALSTFSLHNDGKFQQAFAEVVSAAYAALFDLHGEGAWQLSREELITFFRANDQTSDIVGVRQTLTFAALAAIAGKRSESPPAAKSGGTAKPAKKKTIKNNKGLEENPPSSNIEVTKNNLNSQNKDGGTNFGLTVRVEINLPGGADKETYDNIFSSIKKNLLDG